MTIDDISPSADTVLTTDLRRLFLAAGCNPACHACQKKIAIGATLKLVPHKGTDEMCCANCGEPELVKRDAKAFNERMYGSDRVYRAPNTRGLGAGYSRPSKAPSPRGDA